ncbi:MAG: tyrosine-type recombinase/integrase [Bacteroidetes bacterium]|nr:tyrosine-type recombinase/integrase [Bacteroidota bacterium]
MQKQIPIVPLFDQFIRESMTGKRRTTSGKRISVGTIEQYVTVLKYLKRFEQAQEHSLRITLLYGQQQKLFRRELNYWKKIKIALENYLRIEQGCYDVYIATVFKTIKTFFNYLRKEKGLPVGEFHKQFTMPSYIYQPVLIGTDQLQRFITDKVFSDSLPRCLKQSFDIFLFGCLVGLRYKDLIGIKKTNIQTINGRYFLQVSAQKTGTAVTIPLPEFAVAIVERYKTKNGRYLFRRLSNSNFNLHIKRIVELAGYTQQMPKFRYRKNILTEIKTKMGKPYRFCDHITAHTMRRTAITTLLMLDVPEQVVRRISGHAAGSKEFYRYVCIAQDYSNRHVLMAYDKLLKPAEI